MALLLASRMVADSGTIKIHGKDTATQTTSEINSLVQLVNSKTYIRGGSVLLQLTNREWKVFKGNTRDRKDIEDYKPATICQSVKAAE